MFTHRYRSSRIFAAPQVEVSGPTGRPRVSISDNNTLSRPGYSSRLVNLQYFIIDWNFLGPHGYSVTNHHIMNIIGYHATLVPARKITGGTRDTRVTEHPLGLYSHPGSGPCPICTGNCVGARSTTLIGVDNNAEVMAGVMSPVNVYLHTLCMAVGRAGRFRCRSGNDGVARFPRNINNSFAVNNSAELSIKYGYGWARMSALALLLLLCRPPVGAAEGASVIEFGAIPNDREDDVAAFTKAMKSPHAIVRVPPGRYLLSDLHQYITLHSNKSVYCENGAKLLVPADAVTRPGKTRNGYIFSPVFGVSDSDKPLKRFTIEDCHFVIEKAGVTPIQIDREGGSEIHIRRLDIDGKGRGSGNQAAYGVFLNGTSNSSVTETRIRYTRNGGIFARLADELLVEENEIHFAGVNSSYPFDAPGKAVHNRDYWSAGGISAPSAKNSVISGNVVDNTGGVGILLRGGTNDCRGNRITGNRLSNIGKGGIGIGIRNGGTGSTVDNVVSGNYIQGYMQRWGDAGININHRGKQGLVENLLIENNWIDLLPPEGDYPLHRASKLKVAYPQIIINSSDGARIRDVTVRGNVLRNAPGAAISIKHAESVAILDNEVASAARIGVNRLMLLARRAWPYGESMGYALSLHDTIDSVVRGNIVKSLGDPYLVEEAPRIHVSGGHNDIGGNLIVVRNPDHEGLPVVLTVGSGPSGTGNRFVTATGADMD